MSAGRHREFDERQALHQAMLTFWEKGYLGASLSDLTRSMGINKPSMYAAFGNKEALFVSAVNYYLEVFSLEQAKHLEDENCSLRQRLRGFIAAVLNMQFNDSLPKGCLVSYCSSEAISGNLPDRALEKIAEVRESSEAFLFDFFEKAKAKKELAPDFNTKTYVNLIALAMHGSAAMSRNGAKREDVESSVFLLIQTLKLDKP